jgi:hypothetical protein
VAFSSDASQPRRSDLPRVSGFMQKVALSVQLLRLMLRCALYATLNPSGVTVKIYRQKTRAIRQEIDMSPTRARNKPPNVVGLLPRASSALRSSIRNPSGRDT